MAVKLRVSRKLDCVCPSKPNWSHAQNMNRLDCLCTQCTERRSAKRKDLREMLTAKRNSLEITAEILSLCRHPQNKTQVMYKTNLSWKMLHKYIFELQSRGLLKEARYSLTKYETTEKGHRFVEKWRELVKLL